MLFRSYLLVIALCAAMSPTLQSQSRSNGVNSRNDAVAGLSDDRPRDAPEEKWERDPVVFSRSDRGAIRDYYLGAASNVPAGLAKRDATLPPGRRQRLHPNSMLPAGSQNAVEPLPAELERRLRPLYSGYSRGTIGKDVVLVDDRSRRVKDVLRDVKGIADSPAIGTKN